MNASEVLRGGLVVSAQAYPGEPMRHPETMVQIAEAAVLGGATAVRLQGLEDIRLASTRLTVPIIGLLKRGTEGVFITPTLDDAVAVAGAGAAIVAVDGTRRVRPDRRTLHEVVDAVHSQTGALVMADCGSFADAVAAADAGVDFIGTTLAGYTGERQRTDGPDLDLVREVRAADLAPKLIAEGRIHSPAHAAAALEAGAYAVVVGTAITHPTSITGWFVQAITSR